MNETVMTNRQPPTTNYAERRRDKRIPVSLEVNWEGMSGHFESRICDLSLGGCFIESLAETLPGSLLSFNLRLPTGRWLPLRGQVAYCDPSIGFGLRFSDIPSTARSMVNALVRFYSVDR